MSDIENTVFEDLKEELEITDPQFNEKLLRVKVKQAIREVIGAMGCDQSSVDDDLENELSRYYSNIRNIALYQYESIGAEFSTSIKEDSDTRQMMNYNDLFAGIIPLARY